MGFGIISMFLSVKVDRNKTGENIWVFLNIEINVGGQVLEASTSSYTIRNTQIRGRGRLVCVQSTGKTPARGL